MTYFEELRDGLPLRTVSHGENELGTDQENAGKSKDNEYEPPNMMAKRVELRIGQ